MGLGENAGHICVGDKRNGTRKSQAEWRVFWNIYYNDSRGVVKTDNRPASVRAGDLSAINIGTYGGHFICRAAD